MLLLGWFVGVVWYGFNERIARSVATPHKCFAMTTNGLVTLVLVAVLVAFVVKEEEEEEGFCGGLLSSPGRPGTKQCRMSILTLMHPPLVPTMWRSALPRTLDLSTRRRGLSGQAMLAA